LPRLLRRRAELGPAGLVGADDRLREYVRKQRVVDDAQASRAGVELVPQRLRGHLEPVASQDALLPRERDVVEVLVGGDLDAEAERVAAARRRAVWPRCGLDAAAAAADVLLLLHLDDAVAHVDHVDHLRGLELPLHRKKLAAAARARAIGVVELEDLLDDRQLRLRRRTRALARLALGASARLLDPAHPILEDLGLARELLDEREGRLQIAGAAAQRPDLAAPARQRRRQLLVCRLQRERNAPELLDVLLALDVGRRHSLFRSHLAIRNKWRGRHRDRRERAAPDEVAALDEERQLARGQAHRRRVLAPQRGEPAALEPLLEDAETGAVPYEHLARVAPAIDEQEELAAQRVA